MFTPLWQTLSKILRGRKLRPAYDALRSGHTVADIGVWTGSPAPDTSVNWLEKQVVPPDRLAAVGMEDMGRFAAGYPYLSCIRADGRALPFGDRSVDLLVANAVLEHVSATKGGKMAFAFEMARCARHSALLTTPDRACPLEVHTKIPLAHWLPWWRTIFRLTGHARWASPGELALFSRHSLQHLLDEASVALHGRWVVQRHWFLCFPVSLVATWLPSHQASSQSGP